MHETHRSRNANSIISLFISYLCIVRKWCNDAMSPAKWPLRFTDEFQNDLALLLSLRMDTI